MNNQIHQRRQQSAERHAHGLLTRADVRAVIGAAGRDLIALARTITPPLVALDPAVSALRHPVVIAALVLLSLRASDSERR